MMFARNPKTDSWRRVLVFRFEVRMPRKSLVLPDLVLLPSHTFGWSFRLGIVTEQHH